MPLPHNATHGDESYCATPSGATSDWTWNCGYTAHHALAGIEQRKTILRFHPNESIGIFTAADMWTII